MEHLDVLSAYPDDCRPTAVESLGAAGGFSGARFWRLHTPSGTLCLRRWPRENPSPERLEFIQAVLWHVTREGFSLVPLPRETRRHAGYVHRRGFLWELAPWMPGEADFRTNPTEEKLKAALVALAEFHRAAATFPLPHPAASPSPGIHDRCRRLRKWISGDLARLAEAIEPGFCPELEERARRICRLAPALAGNVLALLDRSSGRGVSLQPCICDVWHDHVLFEGDRVSGLIDFGALRSENVAADVARLLGSMARDDPHLRQMGLDAYRSVRPLSETELLLTEAFDRSTVLMAALNWVDWIYRQRRVFESHAAIPGRLDETILRLEHWSRHGPTDWR